VTAPVKRPRFPDDRRRAFLGRYPEVRLELYCTAARVDFDRSRSASSGHPGGGTLADSTTDRQEALGSVTWFLVPTPAYLGETRTAAVTERF